MIGAPKRIAGVLGVVALLLAWAAGAEAASVPRYSLERLVDSSQFIVQGTVVRSWTGWDSEHKYVWTHSEIQVEETLRGAAQRTLVVSEPGGSLDGVRMLFTGTVPYTVGERVVLFLMRTPIGFLRAAGGGQGKFTVGPDGHARASVQGFDVIGRSADRTQTPLASLESLNLSQLKTRVRELARTRPAPASE